MTRTALVVLFTIRYAAGQPGGEASRTAFRSDSRLVLVPVLVTDHRGGTVNGLTAKAFTILEDKRPQKILSFSEEDTPCSIGIVFDVSGSMQDKLSEAKRTLRAFLDLAGPEDEALVVGVSDHPDLRSGFTNDFATLLAGLAMESGRGNTALVDSIYTAVSMMKKAHTHRRTLLVFSDGMDNRSRYTQSELMSIAVEADVQIYTIAVASPPAFRKPIVLLEENRGLMFLEGMAKRTGGLHFVVRGEDDMRDAAARVGKAMRSQYVIGFRPASERDGKWHRMQIKLSVPDAQAHARSQYRSE